MFKTLVLAGTAFVALSMTAAPSNAAAWCAYQGGDTQYENCGYNTFRQCQASVRGVGGDCRRNPYGDEGRRSYRDDPNTGYEPRMRMRPDQTEYDEFD